MTKRKRLAIAVAIGLAVPLGIVVLLNGASVLFGPQVVGVALVFVALAAAAFVVGYEVYDALPSDKEPTNDH